MMTSGIEREVEVIMVLDAHSNRIAAGNVMGTSIDCAMEIVQDALVAPVSHEQRITY